LGWVYQGTLALPKVVAGCSHLCYNAEHEESAMNALKLTQIGNSVGVILPKELLAKLGVGKGDTIYAIDQPDGVRLTTADPDFESQMEVARKLMKRWRNVLRELAK
jgi:putative addiction module antidote